MAARWDGKTARAYHEATKHSPASVRSDPHRLDWENKPRLFKAYRDRPPVSLPRDVPSPRMDTLEALATVPEGRDLDLETLAELLYHAAGITKRARTATGEWYHFRAAACAGALYPIEAYVVAGEVEGVPAGVYHFAPKEFALTALREGDHRPGLAAALGSSRVTAPAYLVLSAIFWRSAWKYRARAYRYCFWDSGTILANLLATAAAEAVRAEVAVGFGDAPVNALLGLDGRREAALAVVPLGEVKGPAAGRLDIPPLEAETVPLSPEEVEYPILHEIHEASALAPEAVEDWRGARRRGSAPPPGPSYELAPRPPASDALADVIRRRGSTRKFRIAPLALDELSTVLHCATQAVPADFLEGRGTSLQDLYLLVHAVEGLPAGAYFYAPAEDRLHLLREGSFRAEAGFLGLEQALPAEASAVVCFLADLDGVLARYGDRGYRAVQLEAGILGGRMYLAAYALGFGATGLTFYDDALVSFFGPHAEGKDAIFMVALGRPSPVGSRVERVRGPSPGDG